MAPADDCRIVHCSEDGLVVNFDAGVYRLSAVKSAAYKFGDRFQILISVPEDGHIRAVLKPKNDLSDPQCVVGEFCNEVLDQELREVVAEQTEGLRNLLLAHTFSQTSIVGKETETADYRSDPLGIVPPDSNTCSTDQ